MKARTARIDCCSVRVPPDILDFANIGLPCLNIVGLIGDGFKNPIKLVVEGLQHGGYMIIFVTLPAHDPHMGPPKLVLGGSGSTVHRPAAGTQMLTDG